MSEPYLTKNSTKDEAKPDNDLKPISPNRPQIVVTKLSVIKESDDDSFSPSPQPLQITH